MIKVILKSGKDESVKRFHPWIFSGAIKKMSSEHIEGALVQVFDNKDNFLGTGHYQKGSIAVRLISFEKEDVDTAFWQRKLNSAYNYRKACGITELPDTNTYRLVHAEADGMPGLIIDYYNGHLVFQAHSIGMHKQRHLFADILQEIYSNRLKCIYDKSSDTLPFGYAAANGFLFGAASKCQVVECGHHFIIDYVGGQKTGFFIDQRENRKLLSNYVKNKKVLNTFCYSGGFSIYALKHGAEMVHSVDSSKKALQMLEDNIMVNAVEKNNHTSFASDSLDFLKNSKEAYDIIILDPPAYAKHRNVRHNAVQGYKRLNAEALKRINSGGLLFTFSCSQVVNHALFKATITSAAISAGRKTKIIHQLSQAVDHPVNVYHPESEYLKGLVLYVE